MFGARNLRIVESQRLIGMGLLGVALSAALLHGQQSAEGTTADEHASHAAVANARVFGSDAGLILNFIKPAKTADFEAIIAKLKVALQMSDKPGRKQQAASWKVFRAVEAGANGSVLYVFNIDPAVKGADHTVSTILSEAFPHDAQTLYQQYADAYASGQNVVNLSLVSALGQ